MRKQSNATPRQGMTLIEVIIVIAVVVLLAIVLIPAIQSARGKARMQQCKNNLKQIALALHNYHDTYSRFPQGYLLEDNSPYLGWGWGMTITPHLDASPFYNQICGRFGNGLQGEYASADINPTYSVYLCPSAPVSYKIPHATVVTTSVVDWQVTPGTVDVNTFSRSTYFGVAGYLQEGVGGLASKASGDPPTSEPFINAGSLGNIGTTFTQEHRYCDSKNFVGVFGQNSFVAFKDIHDGTSNVIMVGERYIPRETGANSIGHGMWIGVPDCTTAAGLAMSLGDTSIRPNAGAIGRTQTTGFGSHHSGGTHFVCADGAVRFLADAMDIEIYRKLSTTTGDYVESDY